MQETPDKSPIRHLGQFIIKYDKQHNLAILATQTHQLHNGSKTKILTKQCQMTSETIRSLQINKTHA